MFTPEERATVRDLLLKRAQDDEKIVGAALTGSGSIGAEDRWSDVDLYFGVAGGIAREDAVDEWSSFMYRQLGALHHFDLDVGYAIYRGFLLPGGLEVDIAFAGTDRLGATGPLFRPVFGTVVEHPAAGEGGPQADHLIGLAWHHALHAQTAIARRKPWQAEYWISAIRHHVLTPCVSSLGAVHRAREGFRCVALSDHRASRGNAGGKPRAAGPVPRLARRGDRASSRGGRG